MTAPSDLPASYAARIDAVEAKWERGHVPATPLFREVLGLARRRRR